MEKDRDTLTRKPSAYNCFLQVSTGVFFRVIFGELKMGFFGNFMVILYVVHE